MSNCNVCYSRLRKTNYELHYIGVVCSKCFRMSKKKYCELVDLIALRKVNYIIKELLKDKEKYLLN